MNDLLNLWLKSRFPQNYIIKKPFRGALILTLFIFAFAVLYRPLDAHESKTFSYIETMGLYSLVAGASVFLTIFLIKRISWFSGNKVWTFGKEMVFIIFVLTGLGIVIYFIAFALEPPADRWNWSTFLDSMKNAFLTGILPFIIFTAINYQSWLHYIKNKRHQKSEESLFSEEKIHIRSMLKKEKLSFFPSEFLFAESDGNYVVFYLLQKEKVQKFTIRNSISNIEQQVSQIPWFFRTHRAFIINLKQIEQKKGNTAGYRLKVKGVNQEIPVSRQKTKSFDTYLKEFHPEF